MWKLIGLNLFSAPLCVLLFVTKNSIYLSKIAPGNGFCIDCRMDLLFYRAMAALWLSSWMYWDTSTLLFSLFFLHSQLLFWKERKKKRMTEDGKTCGNEHGNIFFLGFSFGGNHLVFILFLSGCSRKFLLLCEVCIILGFYLKFLPVYALSECNVVFTMRDKCWWDTCPS